MVLATQFCSVVAREFIYSLYPFLFILRNYVALFFFSLLIEATLFTQNEPRTLLYLISTL